MGEERSDLVVYSVRNKASGVVVYVGQGIPVRPEYWTFPRGYSKLGLSERPIVRLHKTGLTRAQALKLEAALISKLRPSKNKAAFSSAGGLNPWNKGLKCPGVGGRPKGTPMSDAAKQKLSEALRGRATAWMTGRAPWNKGLTKDAHIGLRKIADGMRGNIYGKRKAT